MSSLEERVAALEAEVVELKAQRSMVRTPFRVVDEAGNVVAQIRADATGVTFSLYHQDVPIPVTLANGPQGGHLLLCGAVALLNRENRMAAVLASQPEGGRLVILNASGDPVAELYPSAETGYGAASVFGPDREPAVRLLGTPDGGLLTVCDPSGQPLARLYTDTERGQGALELSDRDGNPTFSRP
jgi:hypothetical protein